MGKGSHVGAIHELPLHTSEEKTSLVPAMPGQEFDFSLFEARPRQPGFFVFGLRGSGGTSGRKGDESAIVKSRYNSPL